MKATNNATNWPHSFVSCLAKIKATRRTLAAGLLALTLLAPTAEAAPFTPGNVVVYRVGSGTGSLVNTGNPVFLDEFSPTGTLVQSIALPTVNASPNRSLIASGVATSEGAITRSLDGRYLALTGYNATIPHASALASTAAGTIFRTIGLVDSAGTINTATALQDLSDGNNPRSAITPDGTTFWACGGAGGVRFGSFGQTTSTQLATTPTNLRNVQIFGNQLYASSGSGTARLGTVGSGLPITSGQTITNLPGISSTNSTSPYGFFFADLSTAVAGNDTLYIADDVRGLQKFSLVSGTWQAKGSIGTDADDYCGLTATVSGSTTVTLYATRKGGGSAIGGAELVTLTDSSGYSGNITGDPAPLARAAANTAFRGVAFAPYNLPDLTVDLAAPQTAQVGNSFSYILTARNIGNVAASDVDIFFVIPSGLATGTISGTNGFFGDADANVVFFTGGSLPAGASATLTVNVTSATAGTFTTDNQAAVIDMFELITEADEVNNASPQTVSTVVTGSATPAAITTHPASATISSGTTTTLTVAASGTAPLTYQWYQGASGTTTTPVGTNSASFTTPALTATTSYWVKVTNAANPTGVNSNTATVSVNQPAAITTQPASLAVSSGATATLSVIATGFPAPSFQWYRGNSGDETNLIANATSASFTTPPLTASTNYWVKVTNSSGPAVNSNTVTVSINLLTNGSFELPAVTPPFQKFFAPNSTSLPGWVLSEGSIDLVAVWKAAQGNQSIDVSGDTAGTLYQDVAGLQPGATYRLDFDLSGNPGGITQPIMRLRVVAAAETSDFEFNITGFSSSNMGWTPKSLTFVAQSTSARIQFQSLSSGGAGPALDNIRLVLESPAPVPVAPAITTQPASQTIPSGETATFSVVATGTPIPVLQWYRGISGDTTNPISGAISATFTTPALTSTTSYWVQATNTAGSPANSETATITVTPPPAPEIAIEEPSGSPLVSGDTRSFGSPLVGTAGMTRTFVIRNTGNAILQNIQATLDGSHKGDFTVNPSNLPTTLAASATTSFTVTFTPSASGARTAALSIASNDADENLTTVNLMGEGFTAPAFTTQPASQSILTGNTATLSVVATGSPAPAFQWYRGNSGDTTIPVGTNSSSFTTPLLTTTTNYWVRATNASGIPVDSNTATITVTVPPVITNQPASQMIISGYSATLTVAATGNPTPTFQWYRGNSGDRTNPIVGATSSTYVTPLLTAPANYWVEADNGVGSPANSDTAIISMASADANLADLVLNTGTLSPAFSPQVTNYLVKVSHAVSSIQLMTTVSDPAATLTINSFPAASSVPSSPLPLEVGSNVIAVSVRSADLSNTRSYNLTVMRAAPLTLATLPASEVKAATAMANGTVTPFGSALVYFQYGTSTSYGFETAKQDVSGDVLQNHAANLIGLTGNTVYHYRIVAINDGGTFFGSDQSFRTASNPPLAATGAPLAISLSSATLAGAVNPMGLPVEVYFEYGPTSLYGFVTPIQNFPAGTSIVDVSAPITGLTAEATYHFRIVANTDAGTTYGENKSFKAKLGEATGGGTPIALPTVQTTGHTAVDNDPRAKSLQGIANARGGTTTVYFEYGLDGSFDFSTPAQSVGNSMIDAEVSIIALELLPGRTYSFRLVATNSLGTSRAAPRTFTTGFASPEVSTGSAVALSTTSVQVAGLVRANNYAARVKFYYGTNPNFLTNDIDATPTSVSGNTLTSVQADLPNLLQGTTYYYQLRADNTGDLGGGLSFGNVRPFSVGLLSGLLQEFPALLPASEHQGSITVNLGGVVGAGWRFTGEREWHLSGAVASGLANGERVIDFRPVPGYLAPPQETVVSTGSAVAISRAYIASAVAGTGTVTVNLKPDGLAGAQWRFAGETDADWKNSGVNSSPRPPGTYFIESKFVQGRAIPTPVTAVVRDGEITPVSITYFLADPLVGEAPVAVPFSAVSTQQDKPYAYIGQTSSDAGFGSGFVVRKRVVATAGHVAFDDGKLAATTGLRWLFQRERGIHEPQPLIPRGAYLMTGYAAQRTLENTPGTSTPASQNLDAAALYFTEDAGRGGFSGYLASDLEASNEFLISSLPKTLVGYPFEGISPSNQGRTHATPIGNFSFEHATMKTYRTQAIHSTGGNSGGPLCVLSAEGAWYPAAIYLGGSGQMIVRSIDSEVIRLFGFAEVSGDASAGNTGGSFTLDGTTAIGTPTQGAIQVNIEPAAARNAGAGWRIEAGQPFLASGAETTNLSPNTYTVQMASIAGFVPPTSPTVNIQSGLRSTLTFTYEAIIFPPIVRQNAAITLTRGEEISYQIEATNSPQFFTLQGILPTGVTFDSTTGRIIGSLEEAGSFPVTVGASNSGGTDTGRLTIVSLPVIIDQQATVAFQGPMTYQILSSESGAEVTYAATGLPDGLVLDPANGRITGTPTTPGIYEIPITVARKGAQRSATLTLRITGIPPVITQQPAASRSIEFGQSTTLSVVATGLPAPSYQWYEGDVGVTTNPVTDATRPTFTTPILTTNSRFWVRVSSVSGSADSNASVITLTPSSNAELADLIPSTGIFTPAFNAGILSYSSQVPNRVSSIRFRPFPEISQSTLRINGALVISGAESDALPLIEGPNVITITVTAGNGTSTKTYTLTVTRESLIPATFATLPATAVTDASAVVRGEVSYYEPTSVFFEYGIAPNYGIQTPEQNLSGANPVPIQAALSGLFPSTGYQYRIVVKTSNGTLQYGAPMTFTTSAARPLLATGEPVAVTATSARLIGAVNPRGQAVTVYFQYGTTNLYGSTTPDQVIPAGDRVVNIHADLVGLVSGGNYHFRLVARGFTPPIEGEDVQFTAEITMGLGDGIADKAPTIEPDSEQADLVGFDSANLSGMVNPRDGVTFVSFEYGRTPSYGSVTPAISIGNGSQSVRTSPSFVTGLLPGTLYYYRLIARNSFVPGTTTGPQRTFTSGYLPPLVTTGGVAALTSTSVNLKGMVNARGGSAEVAFEYGTDGVNFPNGIAAFTPIVSGDQDREVETLLENLNPLTVYSYRVRAQGNGATQYGAVATFQVGALQGLSQNFTLQVPINDRQGQMQVNLQPAGVGAWRFVGENQWRTSGSTAINLTTGQREVEYQPVVGYIRPFRESIGVVSGEAPIVLNRNYLSSSTANTGVLKVTLLPASVSDINLPVAQRAQWRILGSADATWRNSGDEITGLPGGNYLVEAKAIAGSNLPVANEVAVIEGATTRAGITYFPLSAPALDAPVVIPFTQASTSQNFPYAYVGQIRTNFGSYSGFVVKPRVVATVAEAIFNEDNLTVATDLQWRLQQDRGHYEPVAQTPRGFYVFEGYANQRRAENTPGTMSLTSHNLNVASLYFTVDAGRGGFSGFLASDAENHEFLQSNALKTLVGYPMVGVSPSNQGRMHATPPVNATFTRALGGTYTTQRIRGAGGMTGGPLCVQYQAGSYLPTGIYVGGTNVSSVRAIDRDIIDLFLRADVSSNGGDNNVGGGITHSSFASLGSSAKTGSIKVRIEPEAARTANAWWKLGADTVARRSDNILSDNKAGLWTVVFRTDVAGFQAPLPQTVDIREGQLTEIVFTYLANVPRPVITSANTIRHERGKTLNFQITADNAPRVFSLVGTLPNGLSFNNLTGLIGGVPIETGNFSFAIKAANDGGETIQPFQLEVAASPLELWRISQFATNANTGNAADFADPDGDGSRNIDEYAAGTDPKNGADQFKARTIDKNATQFTLTANGKANRTYVLERRATLVSGNWNAITTIGPLATDGIVTLTDDAPPTGSGFYRIRVSIP